MKQILRLKEPAKSATASFEALLELPEDSFTAVDWGTLGRRISRWRRRR